MRILVALLFLCSVARGQFLSPGLDWSAVPPPPPFSPASIGGIMAWWDSSQLSTNTGISVWLDRINNIPWYQGVSGRQPTNKLNFGVAFESGKLLTNASGYNLNLTNDSVVILYYSYNITSPVFQDCLCDTSENGAILQSSGGSILWGWRSVGVSGPYRVPLNAFQDMFGTQSGSTWFTYSNNVQAASAPIVNGAHFSLLELGNDNAFITSDWFAAYITEVMVFTNKSLSGTDRTNLHTYFTTKWNFSP